MIALPQIGYSGNPPNHVSYDYVECKDCKTRGHFSKADHECKFYKAVSAADVGSSGKKRKQSTTIKEGKKQTTGDIKCISCDLKGHSTSRSLEWKSCQRLYSPTRTILQSLQLQKVWL
ncbi:hypothetical protein BDF20DRAFT_876745 [Mycotypha africana]|uniref:uncharacterized protein n=1 Tax=Mycotypha africana TaxID=64632 RepID=UPI002301409D|nr:uncharacterized protein BDF20DRAFT_876745 [Mycotypha africana]KAI8975065.1 hypothetical protein BDF20DRAFT_876745 [Mycotypha africana]